MFKITINRKCIMPTWPCLTVMLISASFLHELSPGVVHGQTGASHSILEYTDGSKPTQHSAKSTPLPTLMGPRPSYPKQASANGDVANRSQPPKTNQTTRRPTQRDAAASPEQPSPLAVPQLSRAPQRVASADPLLAPSTNPPTDASVELNQLITQLALDQIPHTFEEDKDWGGTAERWDGIDFRRDGFKLRTKRKLKTVNHGTWKKYSAQLRDPQRSFSLEVNQLRELPDDQVGFQLACTADLTLEGRQSKWVKGIQLYSLSASGHAKVRLTIEIELGFSTDAASFPPDLVFTPRATDAQLEILEFRIDRVSKAGGEIAQQVTRATRKALDKKISNQEKKLVKKINASLVRKQDRLRLSIQDAVQSRWHDAAKAFLPASVQAAIDTP